MRKLFVFGNEHLPDDALAQEVGKMLKGVEVVQCTSPDQLMDEAAPLILDVVKNIKKPMLIQDIHQLRTRGIMSMHDFDVAFFLALMQQMGKAMDAKIIGIPQVGDPKQIAREVQPWI